MNNQTIAEIYSGNDKIREKFIETLSPLTDEQASTLPWACGLLPALS